MSYNLDVYLVSGGFILPFMQLSLGYIAGRLVNLEIMVDGALIPWDICTTIIDTLEL